MLISPELRENLDVGCKGLLAAVLQLCFIAALRFTVQYA
jgi:hypothetical protein